MRGPGNPDSLNETGSPRLYSLLSLAVRQRPGQLRRNAGNGRLGGMQSGKACLNPRRDGLISKCFNPLQDSKARRVSTPAGILLESFRVQLRHHFNPVDEAVMAPLPMMGWSSILPQRTRTPVVAAPGGGGLGAECRAPTGPRAQAQYPTRTGASDPVPRETFESRGSPGEVEEDA